MNNSQQVLVAHGSWTTLGMTRVARVCYCIGMLWVLVGLQKDLHIVSALLMSPNRAQIFPNVQPWIHGLCNLNARLYKCMNIRKTRVRLTVEMRRMRREGHHI